MSYPLLRNLLILIFTFFLLLQPHPALAGEIAPFSGFTAPNLQGGCADDTISTALGCIPFSTEGFIRTIMPLVLGLAGAAALILLLYGFFLLATSAGIPDKVKAGQEVITSAVGGLIFIIFSVILLNLLGVQILNIPGF